VVLPDTISLARTKHLLGAGSVATEFLVAPARLFAAEASAMSSLGALINLMVVICDGMLDGGAAVETVLPSTQLAAGGGDGSVVMVLLREYFKRLRDLRPDERVLGIARRVAARMFEAEIETVCCGSTLPYRAWLRKSALPFVMMALPAWARRPRRTTPGYLRWLYSIGRFFGAIDDAVDAAADLASGHPNYWHRKTLSALAAARIAGWGRSILAFWDSLVRQSSETAAVRSSFLYNVWRWLEPI
jgi:hypothetical protein